MLLTLLKFTIVIFAIFGGVIMLTFAYFEWKNKKNTSCIHPYNQEIKIIKVEDDRYHDAIAKDLESYQKIMRDIAPEFDAAFDIVKKPKNAQYFKDKREKYIEKYIEDNTPRWRREGREMCEAIIDEIEEKVRINPESKILHLMNEQYSWTISETLRGHPYNLLDKESKQECNKCLTNLGFEIAEYTYHTRVEW